MNHEMANQILEVSLINEISGFDQKLIIWEEMSPGITGSLVTNILKNLPKEYSKPESITALKALGYIDKSKLNVQQDIVTMMLYAMNYRFVWGRELPSWVRELETNIQNPSFSVEGDQAQFLRQFWLELLQLGLFDEDYF